MYRYVEPTFIALPPFVVEGIQHVHVGRLQGLRGSTCRSRVDLVVDLRYGRLTSELISLSVGSELTFYAVLDSFSARGHGKNCPVKIFEVYVEILGVLYFG